MGNLLPGISQSPHIIDRADALNLNIRTLYEAVIDLSAQGLVSAHCINLAAGILLNDLGLPSYFFENINAKLYDYHFGCGRIFLHLSRTVKSC